MLIYKSKPQGAVTCQPIRMTIIKKAKENLGWAGFGEIRTLVHYGANVKWDSHYKRHY